MCNEWGHKKELTIITLIDIPLAFIMNTKYNFTPDVVFLGNMVDLWSSQGVNNRVILVILVRIFSWKNEGN